MTHEIKIKNIAAQIKSRANARQPVVFTKKTVSHLVPNPNDPKQNWPKINIGALTEILKIDADNKICVAESGVTFSDLVKKTLPLGLIPYVVPELKTITVGGAVSGCSLESMSYKYGGFHDNCLEYEIITGTGNTIICSKEKNSDIFEMLHGSYGTLGVLTKLKFKLYPAKPFVKMTYAKFSVFNEFWRFLQERCKLGDYEFVDAIIHAPNKFVVCLGNMVDRTPYLSSYDWLDIFYKSTLEKNEDYMSAEQYFFRYDTDAHWLSKTIPTLEWKPIRFLFGKLFLGSTKMIKWAGRLGGLFQKIKRRPDVVVDVFVPANKFPEFYTWYEKNFNFYPLWIVPYRMPEIYPWVNERHTAKSREKFFIDCAVYGKKNNEANIDYSELLENKTFELGGIKTLISRNHYSPTRFAEIYNLELYNNIKQKTDPNNAFGTVYKNMCGASGK